MYIKFKLLTVCVLGAMLSAGSVRAATNLISGELTENATWSDTCILEGTVVVRPGVVLNIDPGTKVLLKSGALLLVNGQLLADGTESEPIYFTRQTAGTRWKRIMFVKAADSRLRHCFIEYADSAGDHKDYYDNDGDPATTPPPRNYHEAVVVLASHLDIEGCVFQKLPDDSQSGQGDAIAVISDDPEQPGAASANIRNCRFLFIGQGIHTRHSYVLVESCYFTGHNGDNDDVDLYGESTPPPLIRNNLFLNPNHDDMINPTRCSAIIIGNVIAGSDDHGVVLRDKCAPVMINNLIYDCSSAGIAVQNQCDALLINNTIVNCGRGVRFFDHTGRWGAPYWLFPGSGKATIINCIIWNCPTPLLLTDSPYEQDRGSHATVYYSNSQGGLASASVSAKSTLTWGDGNINSDPKLTDFRLAFGSPCIDAGTNASAIVTNDLDNNPRPLDGNADGLAAFDIGAYEFNPRNLIPEDWFIGYGLDAADPFVAATDPDQDTQTTFQEWVANTDPTDPQSFFRIESIAPGPPVTVHFLSSSNRHYTLSYSTNLSNANTFEAVPGQVDVPGTGGVCVLSDDITAPQRFYRVSVKAP